MLEEMMITVFNDDIGSFQDVIEVEDVRKMLDKIKADLEDCITHSQYFTTTRACCGVRDDVLRVIDKYR